MKRRIILISVIVVLLAGTAGGIWWYHRSHTGWRLKVRVHGAMQAKNMQRAAELARTGIQKYPDDWQYRELLGEALLRSSRFEEAHEAFEAGLEINEAIVLYEGVARSILGPAGEVISAAGVQEQEIRQALDRLTRTSEAEAEEDSERQYTSALAPLHAALEHLESGEIEDAEGKKTASVQILIGRTWMLARAGYRRLMIMTASDRKVAETAGNSQQVAQLDLRWNQLSDRYNEAGDKAIEAWLPAVEVMPDSDQATSLVELARTLRRTDVLERLTEVVARAKENDQPVSPEAETALVEWRTNAQLSEASPHGRKTELREAIADLRQIEKKSPDSVEPRLRRAEYHVSLGELDEADKAISWVLEKNPKNPRALRIKGSILLAEGEHEQAEELLARLTTEHPTNWRYQHLYGQALSRTGNVDLAKQAVRKATELNPRAAGPRLFLIETYLREGQDEVAYREAGEFFDNVPGDVRALRYYVRTSLRMDRADLAREALNNAFDRQKKALETAGQDALHVLTLRAVAEGFASLAARETEAEPRAALQAQAREAVELATRAGTPNAEAALAVAQARLDLGLHSEAEKAIRQLVENNPSWVSARLALADVYTRSGRPILALEQVTEAARLEPHNVGVLLRLSRMQYSMGMLDEALAQVDRVLELQPNFAEARLLRGQIQIARGEEPGVGDLVDDQLDRSGLALAQSLLRKGEFAQARAICRKRLDKDSHDLGALSLMAQAYLRDTASRENVEEACRYWATMIEVQPESYGTYQTMAVALGLYRDPPLKAEEVADRLGDIPNSNEYRIRMAIGELLSRQQLPDLAMRALMELAQDSGVPDWLRARAAVGAAGQMLRAGRREDALGLLRDVGYGKLDWAAMARKDALMLLAQYHMSRRQPDEAAKALLEIKALGQRNVQLNVGILRQAAPMLVRVGKYPEAIEIYHMLSEAFPSEAGADRFRAQLELAAGQFDEAIRAYQAAIAKQPTDVRSYRQLARLYEARLEPAKALETLDEMAEIGQGARLQANDHKAQFFVQRGLSRQAIEALGQIEQSGLQAQPRLRLLLGRAYLALGERESARRVLESVPAHSEHYEAARTLAAQVPEDLSERIQAARDLVTERPNEPGFVALLMRLLVDAEQLPEVLQVYRSYTDRLGQARPNPTLAGIALQTHLELGQYAEAGSMARDLARRHASRAWALRGAVLSIPEMPGEALKILPPAENGFGPEVLAGISAAALMDNDVLVAAWHERYLAQPERMRGMIDHMLVAHLAGKPVSSVSQLPRYDRARSFIRGAIEEYVAWAKANPRAHEEPAMLATALAALQAGGIEAYAAHLAMEQLGKRPESQLAAAIVRQADPSVETLQAVLEKMADPESSVGMDIRATILHQQEEHEQAAALYGQVLRTDPSNNEVRMRQAQALEEADKLPEAMEMYRKVHTVDGNPLAANNAAYLTTQLHADDQAKLTAAQEMLSEAVAEEPRAGYLLDTLGYLNLLLGQDEQAVKQLRRAVLSLPGSIEVQAHLGRAEKQNGQYELARWHLQAAIDLAEAKTESDDKLTHPEKNALAEARETIKLLPRR